MYMYSHVETFGVLTTHKRVQTPGPSVFPSGEPGVSGDFWGSQEGSQTNGGSLWLWCCLPQPGALGP